MSLLRKNALTLGIGALVMGLTILVFFSLTYAKAYMDTLGFCTVLSAEAISVVALLFFNRSSTGSSRVMVSAGAYTAIALYLFISLALSVVFMGYLRSEPSALLTAEAIALALLLIVLIVVFSYGKRISKTNDIMTTQMAAMGTLESAVQLMLDNPRNSQYSRQINEIYEAIRSTDQSMPTKADEMVSSRIQDLSVLLQSPNAPHDKVTELTERIQLLITQRTLEVRQLKKGGI